MEGMNSFLGRHRRKFFVTGLIVGGTYFAFKYAKHRVFKYQERKTREFVENARRVQHFESTERTCNQIIISLGSELHQAILQECRTDELLQQLREKPANKLELWNQLKVTVFTRIMAFVYANSMLVMAMRVQLNVLGGYLYRDVQRENPKISDELKHHYLSLIHYFIKKGVVALIKDLRVTVTSVLKSVVLSRKFSLMQMEELFWTLQMAVNNDEENNPLAEMTKYVLPEMSFEISTQTLMELNNDTLDLLESDDAISVCSNNIEHGFTLVMDALAENWSPPGNAEKAKNTTENINKHTLPFAKIIPILDTLTDKGFDSTKGPQNLPTSLLTFDLVAEKVKTLGANIYESFSAA